MGLPCSGRRGACHIAAGNERLNMASCELLDCSLVPFDIRALLDILGGNCSSMNMQDPVRGGFAPQRGGSAVDGAFPSGSV